MGQTSNDCAEASPTADAVDSIGQLEREFRAFTHNMTRFKNQVSGSRLDRLAVMVLGTLTFCGPSRLTTVAEKCGFDPSTVSRQVADLKKAGLLVREVDPEDRRAVLLKATERGQELLHRLERGRRRRIERTLSGWTTEEISTLSQLLGRLNDAIERYGEQNLLEMKHEMKHEMKQEMKQELNDD